MVLFTLPVLIGLAGLAVGGLRLGYILWKGARATAIERWLAVQASRTLDAIRALRQRNREIETEPPPANEADLEDRINDEWGKRP